MIAAVRISWTPTVCCVQPTAYTNAPVRSGPELTHSDSATARNSPTVQPQAFATNSGV